MVDDVLRMRATISTEESLAAMRAWGREIGMLPQKVKPGVNDLNRTFGTLGKTIQGVGREITAVIPALGGFGLGAAGASVAAGALLATFSSMAKRVVELSEASKELGISERELRAWGGAAERVGISAQSMQAGLLGFKKVTDGFRYQSAERNELFAKGFGPVIERIRAARTETEKLTIAWETKKQLEQEDPSGFKARWFLDTMGIGADKMRLTLEDVIRLYSKLKDTSPEAKAAAKEYADSLKDLGDAFDHLTIKAGVTLFPHLKRDMEDLTKILELFGNLGTWIDKYAPSGGPADIGTWLRKKTDELGITTPIASGGPGYRPTFGERWPGDVPSGQLKDEQLKKWMEEKRGTPQRFTDMPRGKHQDFIDSLAFPDAMGQIEDRRGEGDPSSAQRIVKGGVFEALVDFQSYVQAGAAGGRAAFFGGGGGGMIGASVFGGGGAVKGFRPSRGGGGGGNGKAPPGVTDLGGKPIDPEVMRNVEQLAVTGGAPAVHNFLTSHGYQVDPNWCGDLVTGIVKESGGRPPPGSAVASNWLRWGQHIDPGDVHPGDVAASKVRVYGGGEGQPIDVGDTGGHVGVVGSKGYDPKTGKFWMVDTHGKPYWRSAASIEFRRGVADQPADGVAPASAAPTAGGRSVSDYVKFWEAFNPHPFQDVGGANIGYGTRARPGETSISEPEAAKRMNVELDKDRAAIEKMNPNLAEGSKKALTSLLYNLGGDTKRLKEHGMAAAIMANDPEAMKKAHVEFSHIHGPHGPVLPGLLARRKDELKFYDEAVSTRRIDEQISGTGQKAEGQVHVSINSNGTAAKARTKTRGGLFQKTTIQNNKQMQPTSEPVGPVLGD